MKGRRLTVLYAVLVLLVACGSSSSATSPAPGQAELENGSYQLVNAERVAAGVSPELDRDPVLDEIARHFSRSMRDEGFFAHVTPSGQTLGARLAAKGYSFIAAGENIARVANVPDPAAYAHLLLMENPGHRQNILGSKFQRVGVGVAIEGTTVWITQIYVRRTR